MIPEVQRAAQRRHDPKLRARREAENRAVTSKTGKGSGSSKAPTGGEAKDKKKDGMHDMMEMKGMKQPADKANDKMDPGPMAPADPPDGMRDM